MHLLVLLNSNNYCNHLYVETESQRMAWKRLVVQVYAGHAGSTLHYARQNVRYFNLVPLNICTSL